MIKNKAKLYIKMFLTFFSKNKGQTKTIKTFFVLFCRIKKHNNFENTSGVTTPLESMNSWSKLYNFIPKYTSTKFYENMCNAF